MLNLRYSPSGPFLGEIPGQPFKGLQLRLAEAAFSVALLPVTEVPQEIVGVHGEVLRVELADPSPGRMYKVNMAVEYAKIVSTVGDFHVMLEATWDNGTTWVELGGQTYTYPNEVVQPGPRQAVANWPATLGVNLPVEMPADAEKIVVRALVNASESGIFTLPSPIRWGNRAYLSLAELES